MASSSLSLLFEKAYTSGQSAVLPGSDAGNDGVDPTSNSVIQNHQPCAPCGA